VSRRGREPLRRRAPDAERRSLRFREMPQRRDLARVQQQRLTMLSLILPQQNIGCVERATWLRSDELPPLWVLATLYPDWRESRLYQLR